MVIAKYFEKPVVVLPEECKNRCSKKVFEDQIVNNWVHPFIYAFSDHIIDDINHIKEIKNKLFLDVKDISVIDDAIKLVQ